MNPSDHIPEQIDDDLLLVPVQKQCSLEPPAELDQRVKQMYRNTVSSQQAQPAGLIDSIKQWYQLILAYWRFFRQTPAIAGSLLTVCILSGLLSGLLLPSPWRDKQQTIQSVDTSMVLRNGSQATDSQTATISSNAQLPAEQWLEIIAELLVQQRVEEAQFQLQAFEKHYPNFGGLRK
jgi:hypothetical protein